MKFIKSIFIFLTICSLLTSCFKDEPLNAECDIEQAYVHVDNPMDIFYSLTDTLINVLSNESTITFYIRQGANLTSLAPQFKLTEGSLISPESGSLHDFSNNQSVTYRVTSQDGNYHRDYKVRFVEYLSINEFHFENYDLVSGSNGGQYYVWSDLLPDGTELNNWATANAAFNLTMGSAAADEYPTVYTPDGYIGAGVMLVTRSTGAFGALFGRRMAAGNLFTGSFDLSMALIDQLQSTSMGLPFNRKPIHLTAYYKYKAGDTYTDEDGNVVSKQDKGNIYAVFYINHDANGETVTLHGDDPKTNPNIIAIADSGDLDNITRWTKLDLDFDYDPFNTGKENEVDYELLLNQGYSLAVVCSSSTDGNYFRGAVESTLYVDEILVECDDD